MAYSMRMRITADSTTPFLSRLRHAMTNRKPLNEHIAAHEQELFRGHVSKIASRRHQTANRLGAQPTGHLEKSASSIEASGGDYGVTISFPRNTGLQRAFGDVVITPTNSKYITIPVNRLAYGKRAREFGDLIALRLGPRGTLVLARRLRGQQILETMYVLVKEAHQKQDRGLLPDDEEIMETAELGAKDYIQRL